MIKITTIGRWNCQLRSVVIIGFTVLLSNKINAQSTFLGITAGSNFASLGGDFNDDKFFASFHGGLAIQTRINEKFAAHTGLIYSIQGFNMKDGHLFNNEYTKGRFAYLNVPATIDIKLTKGLALRAGPQFGILTSAKMWSGKTEMQTDLLVRSIDVSLITGMSYTFSSPIQLHVQYNCGLLNTVPGDHNPEFYPNRVIQLGVSWFFYSIKSEAND